MRLTAFQAEEVMGLLDLAADEVANETEGWTIWGTLTGLDLEVHHSVDAAQELLDRADWMEDEGYVQDRNGGPGARSLRTLAKKIQDSRLA